MTIKIKKMLIGYLAIGLSSPSLQADYNKNEEDSISTCFQIYRNEKMYSNMFEKFFKEESEKQTNYVIIDNKVIFYDIGQAWIVREFNKLAPALKKDHEDIPFLSERLDFILSLANNK